MPINRRQFGLAATGLCSGLGLLTGCETQPPEDGRLEAVWGKQGILAGMLQKPRAIAISDQDELYIVDTTARIQVFDRHGQWLRQWQTPAWKHGKPSGLAFDLEGNLMVADTHYSQVLFYTPEGELRQDKKIGGVYGYGPGEFHWVTDCVQDSQGCYYAGEMGEHDRIQKFSPEGDFIMQWGSLGSDPGQFVRPQSLAIDDSDHLWVADACNHRIQVFDATGDKPELVRLWGEQGRELGQFHFPYDLVLDGQGHVTIVEFQNNRVQKLTLEGEPVSCWGRAGRDQGALMHPWALARDSQGKLHVLDSENHRVQRIWL